VSGYDSYGSHEDGSRYGTQPPAGYGAGPHVPEQHGPYSPGRPSPGGGCSKWASGCLIAIAAVVAVLAGLGWYGWSKLKAEVFSEHPLPVEVGGVSGDFRSKIEPVLKAVGKADGREFTLGMTGPEFSYFVLSVLYNASGRRDEWKVPEPEQVKGMNVKLRVSVKDGHMLDFDLGFPAIGDKYFLNMSGQGEIGITDGRLEINLEEVTVGRQRFEGAQADEFGDTLRYHFMKTSEASYILSVVPDLKVDDGNIYMRVKALPYNPSEISPR